VVQDGLRDTSQKQATEPSKSSSSEHNEVGIATACSHSDLPRRISVHQQSLDRISHCPQHRDRLREHFVCVLLAAIVAVLLIGHRKRRAPLEPSEPSTATRARRTGRGRPRTIATGQGAYRAAVSEVLPSRSRLRRPRPPPVENRSTHRWRAERACNALSASRNPRAALTVSPGRQQTGDDRAGIRVAWSEGRGKAMLKRRRYRPVNRSGAVRS
jgi:hypothetical protein